MHTMAGPSIRVWELAHVLARQQPVTIGTPNQSPVRSNHVTLSCYGDGALESLLREHQVVIAIGYLLRAYPAIRKLARYLAMDVYGPFVLENLNMYEDRPMWERLHIHQHGVDVVIEQLEAADFFFCASDRQRDYWLGALSVANRLNRYTFADDPTLRRLIDVVPFGLPSTPPHPNGHGIKGLVPGIAHDDFVVLWTGGIWDWFDPLTVVRAAALVRDEMPAVKFYFMGVRHPNPNNPQMLMARKTEQLARELGVWERQIFFSAGWVPYDERVNYLCDADVAISLHREHIETRLSFRTRMLDYLWAGLPIVATAGDVFADAIAERNAGISVPEGDADSVAKAIMALATDPERRRLASENSRLLGRNYTWGRAARALAEYCRDPWPAADRGRPGVWFPSIPRSTPMRQLEMIWKTEGPRAAGAQAGQWLALHPAGPLILARRAFETWRESGFPGVWRKTKRRLRRKLR
jgi:glycosyltransferase involved in cell wall biosynthesis